MSPLQIILIGLIFIVVLGAGLFFVRAQEAERKKRLLGVVQGSGALKAQNPALSEKDAQNKRRADIAKKLKGSKDGEAGAATAGHKKSRLCRTRLRKPGFLFPLPDSGCGLLFQWPRLFFWHLFLNSPRLPR